MNAKKVSSKKGKSDVAVKNFKLSGEILEKVLRVKTPKNDVRSLYFIINYFNDLIDEYIESLLKKYSKEELLKLKAYGDYTDYFNKAMPNLSPKKFINFSLAKFSYEHELENDDFVKVNSLTINSIDGTTYSCSDFLNELSENECLGLLILLVA